MNPKPLFHITGNRLIREFNNETLWIEGWNDNSVRVRSTVSSSIDDSHDWALLRPDSAPETLITVDDDAATASVRIGSLTVRVNEFGWLSFWRGDECVLEEQWQIKDGGSQTSALEIPGREYSPILGGDYSLALRLKANKDERIYGLGQRQIDCLDLKGCVLELAHRNSQASIPFALSNRGYGFLWNNPAVGRVSFAKNGTVWEAPDCDQFDFWVTVGETPADIEQSYADATGHSPSFPDFATGFWQCKLRYQNQEELLEVAREFHRRQIPLSVIVVDFFHWTQQGDWKFDPHLWPDPDAMVSELRSLGVELMVSIWPTVDTNSENYDEMRARGFLVRNDRADFQYTFMGDETYCDVTNPGGRKYLWGKAKQNYFNHGIRLFWLDEAEPELGVNRSFYNFDNTRYFQGPALKVGNIYPFEYAKAFYEGLQGEGQDEIINLIRCAWAGSQRFGTLLWSGDVHSTFDSFAKQVRAGLNAGVSGIPWWTSDIGGFTGGDASDPEFRELLCRWYEWAVFCPVMRAHGFRRPVSFEVEDAWRMHNQPFGSGAPNEPWSYGDEMYQIITRCIDLRERLRPYVAEQMQVAHETGLPPMRPLFFDFSDQGEAWEIDDEFMFGPDLLIAPILGLDQRERTVFLPEGESWIDTATGKEHKGGQYITLAAPLERIPVLARAGAPIAEIVSPSA